MSLLEREKRVPLNLPVVSLRVAAALTA